MKKSPVIRFETNNKVMLLLESLVISGLYGFDVNEAAERLMCRELDRLIVEGRWLKKPSEQKFT